MHVHAVFDAAGELLPEHLSAPATRVPSPPNPLQSTSPACVCAHAYLLLLACPYVRDERGCAVVEDAGGGRCEVRGGEGSVRVGVCEGLVVRGEGEGECKAGPEMKVQ